MDLLKLPQDSEEIITIRGLPTQYKRGVARAVKTRFLMPVEQRGKEQFLDAPLALMDQVRKIAQKAKVIRPRQWRIARFFERIGLLKPQYDDAPVIGLRMKIKVAYTGGGLPVRYTVSLMPEMADGRKVYVA